jgi:hypothetical protein
MSSLMLAQKAVVHTRALHGFHSRRARDVHLSSQWFAFQEWKSARSMKTQGRLAPAHDHLRPEPLQHTSCLLLIQLIESANRSDWKSRFTMKRLKVRRWRRRVFKRSSDEMFPFSSICLLRFLEIRHILHFLSCHRCHPKICKTVHNLSQNQQ